MRDMPYDRFLKAQLAGDLMRAGTRALLPATGLFGLGPWYWHRQPAQIAAPTNGTIASMCVDPRHSGSLPCLRALPRSQVRSVLHQGLLRARRRFHNTALCRVPARRSPKSSRHSGLTTKKFKKQEKLHHKSCSTTQSA